MAEVLETQELFPVRRPPDRAPGNTLVGDAHPTPAAGLFRQPDPVGKGGVLGQFLCFINSEVRH